MIIDGAFNHERLIEFLVAPTMDAQRKVIFILHNLPVHHCKPVKAWLAEHGTHIEVFYLPSYSLELNPKERRNADLKHVVRARAPARTKTKLRSVTESPMKTICDEPERVKRYFQDSHIKYAA